MNINRITGMGKMRYNVSSMRMMLSISMILLFQLSFLNFANAQKYACVTGMSPTGSRS